MQAILSSNQLPYNDDNEYGDVYRTLHHPISIASPTLFVEDREEIQGPGSSSILDCRLSLS